MGAGERVCLVGRNGVGKSSLMALLSGDLTPDGGTIVRTPGVTFGHMPQAVPDHWSGPVFGVVASGLGKEGEALAAAHLMPRAARISSPPPNWRWPATSSRAGKAGNATATSLRRSTSSGSIPRRTSPHFPEEQAPRGAGPRPRRLRNLLLDEPTNHLDIKTIAWLEDFLVRRVKTFVFISHDRALSAASLRGSWRWTAPSSTVMPARSTSFSNAGRNASTPRKTGRGLRQEVAQEEAWIRQGIKARRTRNMGRVRALQAMRSERMARVSRQGVVSMLAQEAERSGKLVIEAKQAGFAYPDGYRVFNAFSTIIQRGDRIGLIGNNGVGKTTLLRLLLGELEPTEGSIRHGTRLEVSYFDQLRSSLDPEKSVMDNVANGNDTVTINGQQRHVASYLMDFLFESDRLRVPAYTLSGGERNRLLLAKLFTMPSNLLVLDEPTNDLDVETLELLEELLASYSGTVLMVSHDREFLDNLVTTTLALEGDGQVREYVGGYTDWLRQRPEPVAAHTDKPKPKPLAPPAKIGPRKLTFKEQRELQMLKDELEALPGKMAALEDEQHTLEDRLNDPGFFARDPDGFNATAKRISELDDEQTAALQRWEDVEFRIAELEGKAEDK
ncbi:MAG: ATP-binding cassette domain-containing protein [Bilophila wadsworthia]